MNIDLFDRQILKSLQNNCRLSTAELGSQIGLSATACQRRIKKLKESGKIDKEIAVLDGIQIGNYVTIIVKVVLQQGTANNIDNFKKKMLDHPQIQQCYYVTGNSDFVLVVTAESMLEYEKLTRELLLGNSTVQKFHSTVVMENVKVGLSIPL